MNADQMDLDNLTAAKILTEATEALMLARRAARMGDSSELRLAVAQVSSLYLEMANFAHVDIDIIRGMGDIRAEALGLA